MKLIPIRLQPGQDLKAALESWIEQEGAGSGWVVSGIGSLSGAVMGVLLLSLLIELLVRAEQGVAIGATHFALPSGSQEILIGLAMILVLILRPNGLTAGREFRLRPQWLRQSRLDGAKSTN